jgi:hypothetical protein
LRFTLGYKYFAPSRAWAKQSAILISGFYVLVAAGGSEPRVPLALHPGLHSVALTGLARAQHVFEFWELGLLEVVV